MPSASDIRIVFALAASLVIHGMLLRLDTGIRPDHPARAPGRKVTLRLVSPPPQSALQEEKEKAPRAAREAVGKVQPPQRASAAPEVQRGDTPRQPLPAPPAGARQSRTEPPVAAPVEAITGEAGGYEPERGGIPADRPAIQPAPSTEETGSPVPAVVMAQPLYRINPPPPYPAAARRRNLQGTVILEVEVSAAGKVDRLRIRESCGHRILDRAAAAAVREWVFEPGRRNGVHAAMTVLVPVRFALH